MVKFFEDFAGAIFDLLKLFCYFLVGIILVGAPLYGIAKLFEWLF
jgi:hypothetical protein